MKPVVIENPILNPPYTEPRRHLRFTDEVVEARRSSQHFVPPAQPRKRGKQFAFNEWTQDRIEENKLVTQIRERVAIWRKGGYQDITQTTARLLAYWQRPDRERRLFFCQIEALETTVYLWIFRQKLS